MLKPSNTPPSNGWIGSTTGACSSRSETSRPPRRKPPTMPSLSPSQWPRRTQTNLPPGNPVRFNGNDCAILVQGDEGPAQVVRLGHRGTPSVSHSDDGAISSPPAP